MHDFLVQAWAWITWGSPAIGPVGGSIGIASGLAVFRRRWLRLSAECVECNDEEDSWFQLTISNRSDLPVVFRLVGVAWFIFTPLGRHRLGWAFQVDDLPGLKTIPPHGSETFSLPERDWYPATPREFRHNAYLRVCIDVPRHGGACWIPANNRNWTESVRERALLRLYRGFEE